MNKIDCNLKLNISKENLPLTKCQAGLKKLIFVKTIGKSYVVIHFKTT